MDSPLDLSYGIQTLFLFCVETIGSSKKRGSRAPRKGLQEIEVEILIGLPQEHGYHPSRRLENK
uniref:Uncharacterized protein n=1 Tax=Cucumis sativus TaxID=3659 RepID=A0A0A0K4V4_CUCSA